MTETTLPKLLVSKEEARQQIEAQIGKGQQLRNKEIRSDDELEKARAESEKWSDYNKTLLLRLFDNTSVAEYDYTNFDDFPGFISYKPIPISEKFGYYQKGMDSSINSLESIRDRLALYDELSETSQRTSDNEGISDNSTRIFGDEVFIVHGHDEAAKHAVARFVEGLDLKVIILDEQVSRGQTIIEKLEQEASNAGFAIVLLTPDDMGAPKDKLDELKPRARQNVVLELGYFLRGLGRERVCVLHKEEVELPSDIHGIVYVPMDGYDGWQNKLRQEIEHAGLPVQNR